MIISQLVVVVLSANVYDPSEPLLLISYGQLTAHSSDVPSIKPVLVTIM